MRRLLLVLIISVAAMAAYADDPGDPDSVYIGNLDGSPIIVGLNEEVSVPLWLKTDDSVAFMHFPLATENYYINGRRGGEYVDEYCLPNMPPGYPPPSSAVFLNPDHNNQYWTNQSLVAFWDFGEGLPTDYEWCHKFNFFMVTTSNPDVIGETAICFDEGYNPINGGLLFGLSDGITEVIPQVVYGSLLFAETGVKVNNSAPARFDITGTYPNPFNASTTIQFSLPEAADIEISVYNILGQKIALLFDGIKAAGRHSVMWDAGDVPSGVYFARLESGGETRTSKMILLK